MAARDEKVDERTPKFLTREWHYGKVIPARTRERLGARSQYGRLALVEGGRRVGIAALLFGEGTPDQDGRDHKRYDRQENSNNLSRHES